MFLFRLIVGLIIVVVIPGGFLISFSFALGGATHAAFDGMLYGLASAVVWGVSTLGVGIFNNAFNCVAALFAAVGVGFVSGAEIVCRDGNAKWLCYVAMSIWP